MCATAAKLSFLHVSANEKTCRVSLMIERSSKVWCSVPGLGSCAVLRSLKPLKHFYILYSSTFLQIQTVFQMHSFYIIRIALQRGWKHCSLQHFPVLMFCSHIASPTAGIEQEMSNKLKVSQIPIWFHRFPQALSCQKFFRSTLSKSLLRHQLAHNFHLAAIPGKSALQ